MWKRLFPNSRSRSASDDWGRSGQSLEGELALRACDLGRRVLRGLDPLAELRKGFPSLPPKGMHSLVLVLRLAQPPEAWVAMPFGQYRGGKTYGVAPGPGSWALPAPILVRLIQGEAFPVEQDGHWAFLPAELANGMGYPLVLAPVLVLGGLWGVLGISSGGLSPSQWAGHLQSLSEDLATALERSGAGEGKESQLQSGSLLDGLGLMVRVQSSTHRDLLGDKELARVFGSDILDAPDRLSYLLDRIHPGDRARVERAWATPAIGSSGESAPQVLNYRVQTLDGITRHIEETIFHPEPGRTVARLEDNSSLRRSRDELEQFREIVERDGRMVLVLRADGTVLYANRAAQTNLGARLGRESRGGKLGDFLQESQGPLLHSILPVISVQGIWSGDLVLMDAENQQKFPVHATVRSLATDGSDGLSQLNSQLVLIAQDRSQQYREQQRWMKRLATLRTLVEHSNSPPDAPICRLTTGLLEIAARHFEAGLVLYARASGSRLEVAHVFSADPSLRPESLEGTNLLELPVFQTIWRSGDLVEFLTPESGPASSRISSYIRWALGIPVTLGNRRHGVFLVADNRPRANPSEEGDTLVLRLLGRCLGSSLERHEYRTRAEQGLARTELANRAKCEFLALMSHELRTPLNGVMGFVEMLRTTELTPEQQSAVETIGESSMRLVRLLEEILDYANLESSDTVVDLVAVEPRQLLESVIEAHAPKAVERGIELIWAVDPLVPGWIETDPTRLRQILDILIENAVEHTFEGMVHVTLGVVPDPGSNGESNSEITLLGSVRDTGLGMGPEELNRLFQPFTPLDSSSTRSVSGPGLGLAICRRACQLLGGDVEVRSKPGEGSSFSFHVRTRPLPAKADWLDTPYPMPVPRTMDPLAGRSALLVAETRELRHAITSLLLQWGMKVVALADLLDLPESAPLPDLLIACEEDILGQGGFGILRERLGSIPLVTLYRPVPGQWTTTPVAPDFNSEDTSLSGQQLIRIPRPVLREPLRHAVQAAVELGLMDSASPIRDSGLVETVAARYPLRVLVVEDNPTNLRVALLLLSNLGYRADHVSNGQEAVDAVRETAFDPNRCYELILMDVHMPLMDGLEATRQIRRLISRGLDGENLAESVSQPYISALTADALAGDREKCLAAGMDDYLSKPMTLADLRRLVKRAYRARRDVLRNSV